MGKVRRGRKRGRGGQEGHSRARKKKEREPIDPNCCSENWREWKLGVSVSTEVNKSMKEYLQNNLKEICIKKTSQLPAILCMKSVMVVFVSNRPRHIVGF